MQNEKPSKKMISGQKVSGTQVEVSQSSHGTQVDTKKVLDKALKRALGGGLAGASAMAIQVTSLMWMRTTMNYQYRNGTTTTQAWKALYNDGGLRRFYRGYFPALMQGPLSRFGDTAANTGVLALLEANPKTRDMPVGAKTFCASLTAAAWRIFLMPIDATKTSLQVHGKDGLKKLGGKLRAGGPTVLWHGSLAAYSATLVGHFPWFFTFNTLNANLPEANTTLQKLGRNALMGFSASVVSDTCSNSIRVVKTYKQTSPTPITYSTAVKDVVASDGVVGLFGRGLKTRILANGMQGLMFSVLWKAIEERINARHED